MSRAEQEQIILNLCPVLSAGLKAEDGILDLGCGLGRHSIELLRKGFKRVVGLDINLPGLVEAVTKAQELNVSGKFVQGNWSRLPFSDVSFQLVFMFYSGVDTLSKKDLLDVFSESKRVLEPDGKLLCEARDGDKIVKEHTRNGRLVAQIKDTGGWTDDDGDNILCRQTSTIALIKGQWQLNCHDDWIVKNEIIQSFDYGSMNFYTQAQLSRIFTQIGLKLKQSFSFDSDRVAHRAHYLLLLAEK